MWRRFRAVPNPLLLLIRLIEMELDPWTQSLISAMTALWTKVAGFIPNLFVALVLVLLGFVVAKLLDTLLSKLLGKVGLDRLMTGTGLTKMLARVGIHASVSTLIGKIVYWFVLLIFLVSAAESLGLQRVSATLDVLALYLPKVFGAALVLLAGVLLAQLVSSLVRGAAEGVGLEYAHGLGRVAQGLVIIISISVAIGQLEVKTDLLNNVIAIVLISVGLAVALALGLGSRDIASQILAGIYVRELYQVGQQVQVGDVEGQIEEIGTVKTTLLTDSGELVSVANRVMLEQRVNSR
jgi:small-conductance mechanosensitive channel